jgi:hypothetical protein
MRSNTGVPGLTDAIDSNIYSAGVFANGASGELPLFSVPQGGTMLSQPSTASLANHQSRYDVIHTNLKEAGRLGSLGDSVFRAIGVRVENAGITQSTAAPTTYGATAQELAEILSKVTVTLKIATREYIEGPVADFPALGGMDGTSFTTIGNQSPSIVRNGSLDRVGRRLAINIKCGRADNIEAKLRVTSGTTLVFQGAANTQPCLVWVTALGFLGRDVR